MCFVQRVMSLVRDLGNSNNLTSSRFYHDFQSAALTRITSMSKQSEPDQKVTCGQIFAYSSHAGFNCYLTLRYHREPAVTAIRPNVSFIALCPL